MAHRFTVIFEKEAATLSGCHTQSETIEEGVENIREASGSTSKPWSKTACPSPQAGFPCSVGSSTFRPAPHPHSLPVSTIAWPLRDKLSCMRVPT
jgi:hypothetical protein